MVLLINYTAIFFTKKVFGIRELITLLHNNIN